MDSHATDQCNDKHACGRREQLRNPDRHRELEAPRNEIWVASSLTRTTQQQQIGSRGLATSQSVYCPLRGSATLRAARHHPRASLHTSPASTATSARSTASPSTRASGPPSPPTAANRCTGGRVRHHRPLPRADDARIIAPRATERHALRFAIPTRHTVMMGPWVPPPTSRAPAPCQITSATPGHIALGVTPNTEYRPQWPADGRTSPTTWMG